MKDGLKHGREITYNEDGTLLLIEPYVKGKNHGTAKQYGRNGKVIGRYTIVHGTGFDIWRQEEEDNTVFISEIHSLQNGRPHGYEWWFASARKDLWQERHWYMGKLHGIERVWNDKGRLRRGYPKFYVSDQAVTKQKYIEMALQDKTLPALREKDNSPFRKLPSEVK
jgi:antitoxin component YwqK of YwqJK toxin-antitoxin module